MFSFNIKRKRLVQIAVGTLLLISIVVFGVSTTYAGPGLPFGGRIIATFYCTCSHNFMVTIMPVGPFPPIYIVDFATIVYPYYQVYRPGPWVLGNYLGASTCLQYAVFGCITLGVYPRMFMVGTSM